MKSAKHLEELSTLEECAPWKSAKHLGRVLGRALFKVLSTFKALKSGA